MKLAAFTLAVALIAAACTSVEPWERERLSHDCMQVTPDSTEAQIRAKSEAAREGSAGGISRGGGGCGCE